MGRIDLERHFGGPFCEFVHSLGHALNLGRLGSAVSTGGSTQIRRQIGQRVRFENCNDGNYVLVAGEYFCERVDVFFTVGLEALGTVSVAQVVAAAVWVGVAADLSVVDLGLAVAVGQILDYKNNQWCGVLTGCIGENSFSRVWR